MIKRSSAIFSSSFITGLLLLCLHPIHHRLLKEYPLPYWVVLVCYVLKKKKVLVFGSFYCYYDYFPPTPQCFLGWLLTVLQWHRCRSIKIRGEMGRRAGVPWKDMRWVSFRKLQELVGEVPQQTAFEGNGVHQCWPLKSTGTSKLSEVPMWIGAEDRLGWAVVFF